mmetsp:Transcript_38806/g.121245  ORF Transcript_38806/g.121245 Transcript_38806/m.121245 type:complete len:90 (-) Transcript_38806:12-281(-)
MQGYAFASRACAADLADYLRQDVRGPAHAPAPHAMVHWIAKVFRCRILCEASFFKGRQEVSEKAAVAYSWSFGCAWKRLHDGMCRLRHW